MAIKSATQALTVAGALVAAVEALPGTCGFVFRYAIVTGHAERDPVPDLRGAIAVPVTKHFAAISDPKKLGELLRAIYATPATRPRGRQC